MTEATWAIDCMEASLDFGMVPVDPPVIFAYKTGTTSNPDIQWTETDIARFPHSQIYRIHQGFGSQNPFRTDDGIPWDEADLEAGAWTVPLLASAIEKRNAMHWSTRVYASDGPWSELIVAAIDRGIPLHSVYWREANWNLSEGGARARIGISSRYAVQWASPSSNPNTPCPGSGILLRTSNLDLNVTGLRPTGWVG